MIEFIWYDLLYQPLYNLLLFFYSISPGRDMGLAVILFTIFIRIILLPLNVRGARAEIRLEQLKPVIEEIKTRYKHNLEKQREAIRRLLKKNHIGVLSNIVALFFQLFFFFVLYEIFASGLQPGLKHNFLYAFNIDPGIVDPYFFGRLNLIITSNSASLFAAGVMLVSQIVHYMNRTGEKTRTDLLMVLVFPLGIYLTCIVLPSAKALFLSTTMIFTLLILAVKMVALRYIVKDEKLKQKIDDLWIS
jgi:YidC/Oxa1 family membrane protein insertase